MPPIIVSRTYPVSLEEVIARLGRHQAVDGVLVMGSASHGAPRQESDYDLFVVLSEQPAPLFAVLTSVDRRLCEVYFASVEEIDEMLVSDGPVLEHHRNAPVVRWLQAGRVACDRSGRLARAREKLGEGRRTEPASDLQIYMTWFSVNYNLQQTKRMLASDDPTYLTTVDLRLLYTISALWSSYFSVRRLPVYGEKAGIRYLAEHDPKYLELFRRCLGEADRTRKFLLYERLAQLAIAPAGRLMEEGDTAIEFKPEAEWQPDLPERALAFWESLISE